MNYRNLNDLLQVLKDLTAEASKQGIEHVTLQPEIVVEVQAAQFRQR